MASRMSAVTETQSGPSYPRQNTHHDQSEETHPIANRVLILLAEGNPGVMMTLRGEDQEIRIMGANHRSHFGSATEMDEIAGSQ
jgi:hypothetical protein